MWPQYTILALVLVGLGASLSDHGRPRSAENAWTTLIAAVLNLWLLYMGGFFKGM